MHCLILNVLYTTIANNAQRQKNVIGREKPSLIMKVLILEGVKIAKTKYGKAAKQAIKLTTFDPTSLELDHLLFTDSLRAGLEEHLP